MVFGVPSVDDAAITDTVTDITYASLATAFNLPLKYDDQTMERLEETAKHRKDLVNQTDEQKEARNRMALFPYGENNEVEVLFVDEELWVVSTLSTRGSEVGGVAQ